VADKYEPSIFDFGGSNAWDRRRIDRQIARVGDLCTVEQIGAFRNYKIISSSKPPPSEVKATTLWEVLEKWGNTWLGRM